MWSLPGFEAALRRIHFGPFRECPPSVWRWFVDRCGASPVAAVAHRAWLMHQLDLRSQLADIRQPILFVDGDSDPTVNRAYVAELLNGLPNSDRVELNRCGHYPQLSHAGVVAEVIRRFLTPAELSCLENSGGV
jgi:pimeloyl-ACP methyl ester carboxylesterase